MNDKWRILADGAQKIEAFPEKKENRQKEQGVNKQEMFWFVGAEKKRKNGQKKAGIKKKTDCPAIFKNKIRKPQKQIKQKTENQTAENHQIKTIGKKIQGR